MRRTGESQWIPIFQAPEFHMLCPFINSYYASNSKIGSLNGNVTLSNDIQRLAEASSRVRASQDFYNRVGFHAPIYDKDSPGLISRSSKIFRCWDSLWVGPLLTPGQPTTSDDPGSFLLYLFALNTNKNPETHQLHPYDYPLPKEETENLTFTVPAGGLAFNKVRVPASRDQGKVHTLTFRTATTSDKLAKGALVGAVTLGSVVYKAGHRGFSIAIPAMVPSPAITTTSPRPVQLYCWCSRPLDNLYCEGCSSRPFICQCDDGPTRKISQQFLALSTRVQDSFRSMDLSKIWQKTPAELTAEERAPFGTESTSQTETTLVDASP